MVQAKLVSLTPDSAAPSLRSWLASQTRLMSSYVTSPFPPIPEIPASTNIATFVMERWEAFGDKLAVIDGVTGNRRSFCEMKKGVDALTALFVDHGLLHGDRIALISPNHPDYGTVLLAAMRLGITVSPMNPTLTAQELSVQLRDADIKMVIASPSCPQALVAAGDVPSVCNTLQIGPELDAIVAAGGRRQTPSATAGADDVAILPYSSGTTGLPKGTMISHRNIVANLHQIMAPDGAYYTAEDVLLSPLPMFHIYPLTVGLLFHLWNGNTYVSMSGPFSIAKFCSLAAEHQANPKTSYPDQAHPTRSDPVRSNPIPPRPIPSHPLLSHITSPQPPKRIQTHPTHPIPSHPIP